MNDFSLPQSGTAAAVLFPKPFSVTDPDRSISAVHQLDLEPIQYKMMDPEEGEGWTREKVKYIAVQYKRFLILKLLYPDITISPTRDIDKMWHYHILDTSKYMVDCDKIFGHYLHHFPYLGMRGEKDRGDLEKCFAETKALYLKHFNEEMGVESDQVATSTCNTYCGGNINILADLPRPRLN